MYSRRHEGRMRYAPTHFREMFWETGIVWASSPPWRAYAIRPYTFSLKYFGKWELVGALRRHDGRMRYAPTHFRELFCEMEMVGASFPAMEGVCDTPLHLFAEMFCEMGIVWASSPPWRAYAIRPYIFSLKCLGNGTWLGLIRCCEGVCDTPLHLFAEMFL